MNRSLEQNPVNMVNLVSIKFCRQISFLFYLIWHMIRVTSNSNRPISGVTNNNDPRKFC